MTNARELLALRTHLATHMRPADAAKLAWPAVTSVVGSGFGNGWKGAELAATALLGAYSDGVKDAAAYVVANLRDLAQQDPPRDVTPTPPPIGQVLALTRVTNPSRNPTSWANQVRQASRKRHATTEGISDECA